MQTILSTCKNHSTSVPQCGGITVKFENHLAVVSDEIGAALISIGNGMFSLDHVNTPEDMKSILVIRDTGLGDVLMVTPLLRELKKRGVDNVSLATKDLYANLFTNNPNIDHVYSLEKSRPPDSTFDAVLDLRMYCEHRETAGRHANRARAFCKAIDVVTDDLHLDLFLEPEEIAYGESRVNGSGKSLAFIWRSSSKNRQVSEAKRLEYITALVADGWKVVLIDHEHITINVPTGVINLSGLLSIRQMASVINACDTVYAPDTGAFHVAAALDKPIITSFGAFPLAERSTNMNVFNCTGKCNLMPCRQYYCVIRDADGTPKCLSIDANKIVAVANSAIGA